MRFNLTLTGSTMLAIVSLANPLAQAQDQSSLKQRIEQLERQVERLAGEIKSLRADMQTARSGAGPTGETASGIESLNEQDGVVMDGVSFFGIHSWLIQVSQTDQVKRSDLETQLENTRAELGSINQHLEKALRRSREVSKQRPVLDLYRGQEVMKNVHPQATIDQAKLDVANRQQQQRAAQAQMVGLQRRIAAMRSARELLGQTADGRVVKLKARDSDVQMPNQIQPGQWYRVSGTGNEDNGVLNISVQAIKQVASP